MLEVYKEASQLKKSDKSPTKKRKTIFDLDQKQELGLENSVSQLKAAIDKVKTTDDSDLAEAVQAAA